MTYAYSLAQWSPVLSVTSLHVRIYIFFMFIYLPRRNNAMWYRLPVVIDVYDTRMHQTFTGTAVLSCGGTLGQY